MSQDIEKDPLSKVFDALWQLADESVRLKSLVRPGNMIRFNGQSDAWPDKDQIGQSDLPELTLVCTSLTGKMRNTSSSSMYLMQLEWWLATGQAGMTNAVLPLAFAVAAAMTPWPTAGGVASRLTWRDRSFIKRVDLLTAQFGMRDAEKNRGVTGWSAVWACEVEIWLDTSEVVTALGQVPYVPRR